MGAKERRHWPQLPPIQNDSGLSQGPAGRFRGILSRGKLAQRVPGGEPMLDLRRRQFITLLGGTVAAPLLPARAQQGGKVYRIGVLEPISAAQNASNLDRLRKGLSDLGYLEGQNLVIEYRSADGRAERFPDLASELVGLNVDLILTRGTRHQGGPRRDRNNSSGYDDNGRPRCHRGELRTAGRQYHGGDYIQH
jgi:hypothetical protein